MAAGGAQMPGEHRPELRVLTGQEQRRGMAIALGTLAAAIGLGLQLWVAGIAIYLIGHAAALFLTRQDPQFGPVFARHLRAARRHLDV